VVRTDAAEFCCNGQRYAYLVAPAVDAPLTELTPAERGVVELVANGCTSREVAERRRTSVHTVNNHLASIYRKLQVTSRYELVSRLARASHDRVEAQVVNRSTR
jgi:DNA-binding CsgD family transcriptional regulator